MSVTYTYLTTDEDPSVAFRLLDRTRSAIDVSVASAWSVYVVNASTGALAGTYTTVTGYATLQGTAPHDYNALLVWTAGDLATLGAGTYRIEAVQATISARQRSFLLADPITIVVKAVPS